MITVVIGQRGTGKTALLGRIRSYLSSEPHLCLDLDYEIEKRESKKIVDIFTDQGEEAFRELEKKYFKVLLQESEFFFQKHNASTPSKNTSQNSYSLQANSVQPAVFIVVGGGFDVTLIPRQIKTLYLQRSTDSQGRLFLDRPILEPNLPPIDEFLVRYKLRREKFSKCVWEEYIVPEGLKNPSEIEKQILFGTPCATQGILTLMPQYFENQKALEYFILRRLNWGIEYFEIRDDLLKKDQIKKVLEIVPCHKILLSRRDYNQIEDQFLSELEATVGMVDYDRDFLTEKNGRDNKNYLQNFLYLNVKKIISVHYYNENESLSMLLKSLEDLETKNIHIKLAVEIKSFEELYVGDKWQSENSLKRSFLPRSSTGRWQWYRLWKSNNQQLNFWREGEGSAKDQPSLYQWLQRRKTNQVFAALLGFPVDHSYTPIYHQPFFDTKQMTVLAVAIEEQEFKYALSLLTEMGLVAAAVTSPLKFKAFEYSQPITEQAQKYKTVNTLVKNSSGSWLSHNTDEIGLITLRAKMAKILSELAPTHFENSDPDNNEGLSIAVWGGGGTLPLLRNIFHDAEFFSIQTGQSRENKDLSHWAPEVVVWAAGRFKDEGVQQPPSHWQPKLVVDLNYKEDSGGRELAVKTKSRYLSGDTMFYAQADAQQIFWNQWLS